MVEEFLEKLPEIDTRYEVSPPNTKALNYNIQRGKLDWDFKLLNLNILEDRPVYSNYYFVINKPIRGHIFIFF